jgi:hypothetical protein
MRFSGLLMAGAVHRFTKTLADGRSATEAVYDVRTTLSVDETGARQQRQLEQGQIAAEAVLQWFECADDLDEAALAEKIPALPRHPDSYPARMVASR